MIKTYKDLKVWQKAHKLVLDVYKISRKLPSEEKFGIIQQLRRSASAIPTNIVEGHERSSTKEFLRFLNIAKSSLEEARYQILLCKDLRFISNTDFKKLDSDCDEIGKMLFGLQKSLKK